VVAALYVAVDGFNGEANRALLCAQLGICFLLLL